MTETIAIESLRARAGWYRLLAGVFAEEPRGDFLDALRGESTLAALDQFGVQLGPDFSTADRDQVEDDLACEYSMLFVAPGGFPPVESVRLQGGFRQGASSAVRTFYTAEGFAAQGGRFAVFEDHLSVELGFIAALLERQTRALEAGDAARARQAEKTIKRFWVQHLGLWVRGFASVVVRAAEHPFYREMARLLGAFAESELELLGLEVADTDGGSWRAPRPAQVDEPIWCGARPEGQQGVAVGMPV